MPIIIQSHGGVEESKGEPNIAVMKAAPPAAGDVAADEQSDFGYFFPYSDPAFSSEENFLPAGAETIDEIDELAKSMIDSNANSSDPGDADKEPASPDSAKLFPILTYWGQFLDHELTARTDRDSSLTSIKAPHPPVAPDGVEADLKNARSPRFDLDSVYGGVPLGPDVTKDVATVISAMRHPVFQKKMRVGTARTNPELPDGLDEHRDLPRYVQATQAVRDAAIRVFDSVNKDAKERQSFRDGLPKRAMIGDSRNDENLVVAQFHVSVLRFHNKAVDFLEANETGWIADFHSAQQLTRLHYQWLVVEGYLKSVCDPAVVERVIKDRASHFFQFRAEFDARNPDTRLGNAIPLEFSGAAFRFGHSMVRAFYDYNKNFGRGAEVLPTAPFDLLFHFTGGAPDTVAPRIDESTENRLPQNWVIDWTRFTGQEPLHAGEPPARLARKIDTQLAPPLGVMLKEGNEKDESDKVNEMFKHLARRNLRRGYNLRLPTGQALHAYIKGKGALVSEPIEDVSTIFDAKNGLRPFLAGSKSRLHQRTPLWFYCLAEAEKGGGDRLGELGSWLVASTFVGVLLADPDSALARGFEPKDSPLRMHDGSKIDSIVKWLKFAAVMP